MNKNLVIIVVGIFLVLGILIMNNQPINANAAVSLKAKNDNGAKNSFRHGSPTATVAQEKGNPAFGRLQPIEPLNIGTPQEVCRSKTSVMFLGVNLGSNKKDARQLYPLVTTELYLDGNFQNSERSKLEKYVNAHSKPKQKWYQYLQFVFIDGDGLSLGTHTASSIVKYNGFTIFSDSDTFLVKNC